MSGAVATRSGELTALQRQALEGVERASGQGVALSAYVRAQGISVRQVHDVCAQLRRKGMLSATSAARIAEETFVALKVVRPAARGVCRIACVYPHRAPVDMRKQMDGLAILACEVMRQSPMSGALIVFINRSDRSIFPGGKPVLTSGATRGLRASQISTNCQRHWSAKGVLSSRRRWRACGRSPAVASSL